MEVKTLEILIVVALLVLAAVCTKSDENGNPHPW